MTIDKRKERFVKDLSGIHLLCELIKIYHLSSMEGTRFKNQRIADKAEKIKSFANSIQNKELKGYIEFDPKKAEFMENEHSLQLWRIMDYFMFQPTDQLEEFADSVESIDSLILQASDLVNPSK